MRDAPAPRVLPLITPLERAGESFIRNGRDDRPTDLPGDNARVVKVADLPAKHQRHRHGAVLAAGFDLALDLQSQGNLPALFDGQEAVVVIWIVCGRVPQLGLGIAPPLG